MAGAGLSIRVRPEERLAAEEACAADPDHGAGNHEAGNTEGVPGVLAAPDWAPATTAAEAAEASPEEPEEPDAPAHREAGPPQPTPVLVRRSTDTRSSMAEHLSRIAGKPN